MATKHFCNWCKILLQDNEDILVIRLYSFEGEEITKSDLCELCQDKFREALCNASNL